MRLSKILLLIVIISLSIISLSNLNSIVAAEKTDLTAAFLSACETGDRATVIKLLSQGVDVNGVNNNDESGLILACGNGHVSLVTLLVQQKGIKINATDIWEGTALHQACEKNFPEIVRVLLEHSANLNQKNNLNETPLLVACRMGNYQIMKLLLDKGAEVHVQQFPFKKTALHLVSEAGFLEGAQWLIAKGADVNARDEEGKTPLHYAGASGQDAIVTYLLTHQADPSIQDYMGVGILHEVCKAGQRQLAQKIISMGMDIDLVDCNGKTPLHYACSAGNREMVETLLKLGADLNAVDNVGGTALHHACYYGKVEVAELLIEKGIAADVLDNNGITPLHLACYQGHQRMVQMMLAKGVRVNVKDKQGKTPLDLVENVGAKDLAQMLISKQAKTDTTPKAFKPYTYQNYQINKKPIRIDKVTYSLTNTDSSFWDRTDFPQTEQLYGFFKIYISELKANRERIKEVSIWRDDETRWKFSKDELEFADDCLEFTNLTAGMLAKECTLFNLRGIRVEIVTFDGRVDCYQVDISEPGSLEVGKKFAYSPSYRGKISSDYVMALQTGKISSAKLTSKNLSLSFKVTDSRVYNGCCFFYDQNKQYVAMSDNWVNPYSRELSQDLNQGQGFYTNGQMNLLQLAVSDITFEENKRVSDIRYVMVYLQDGAQFKDHEEAGAHAYASRSKLFPCKVE